MKEALISRFIELTSAIGLNYEFLNSGYELDMWLNGMITTLKLVAITIPLSLFFRRFVCGRTDIRQALAGRPRPRLCRAHP